MSLKVPVKIYYSYYLYMWGYVLVNDYALEARGIRSPESGIMCSYESLDLGPGN